MNELPFIKCPSCKEITLHQIVAGNAVACSNFFCQTIFNSDLEKIGVFKNGKATYDIVNDSESGLNNYSEAGIGTKGPKLISIEDAETGKALKIGDILPKFLMIKISL